MLTLTVRQPWAHLIAHGLKKIENRSWFTAHRGPLAIHAAKSRSPADLMEELERDGILPPGEKLTYGAIIAVVTVTDCIAVDDLAPELDADPFGSGPWCWLLGEARPVGPIPCKGQLGLWEFAGKIRRAKKK